MKGVTLGNITKFSDSWHQSWNIGKPPQMLSHKERFIAFTPSIGMVGRSECHWNGNREMNREILF